MKVETPGADIAGSAVTKLPPLHRPQTTRPVLIDAVHSEFVKLGSLRSTYWTLAVAAAAMVGLGALFASRFDHLGAAARASISPASYSLSGFFLAQLAVAVFGVLAMTSEYSTGSIRATLAALPQRHTLLAAKAIVLIAVTAVVGTAASFGAFFAGRAILSAQSAPGANLGDPAVLRAVIGAGLYLTVLSLGSLAIGTLIRRPAGAIATVAGLVFVLPGLVEALPASWQNAARYLPSNAGQAIIGHTKFAPAHTLGPWTGFGLFCGYVAIAFVAAALILNRRDA